MIREKVEVFRKVQAGTKCGFDQKRNLNLDKNRVQNIYIYGTQQVSSQNL